MRNAVASLYSLLRQQGITLAVAESFTGGGVCARLVRQVGMSEVLKKGIVCYSNECKIKDLRVSADTIAKYGAVSEQTAEQMLDGLLREGYGFAIATTGNAGPTAEKEGEEGVCYVGVAYGNVKKIERYCWIGDRKKIIQTGINAALELALTFAREALH